LRTIESLPQKLAVVETRLSQLDRLADKGTLEAVKERLASLARADQVTGIDDQLQTLVSKADLEALRPELAALRKLDATERLTAIETKLTELTALRSLTMIDAKLSLLDRTAKQDLLQSVDARLRSLAEGQDALGQKMLQATSVSNERASRMPAAQLPLDPNDLKRIAGVGPALETRLRSLGVESLRQIAEWKPSDIEHIEAQLGQFRGRIERDKWIDQAKKLVL
jgi:predicted flap endonuclease-1-like 5' DNA nuclease